MNNLTLSLYIIVFTLWNIFLVAFNNKFLNVLIVHKTLSGIVQVRNIHTFHYLPILFDPINVDDN